MYSWIWRHLPGPTPVRLLASLMLFALVVALLFTFVFPRLERYLPTNDVTVENASAAFSAELLSSRSSAP